MVAAWPRPIDAIFPYVYWKEEGELSDTSVPLIHPILKKKKNPPYRFIVDSSPMTLSGLIRHYKTKSGFKPTSEVTYELHTNLGL